MKERIRKIAGLSVLLGTLLFAFGDGTDGAQNSKSQDGLYYVVIKQAEIKGQVFVITDEEDGMSRPATDLPVVVKDPERADKIITVKTDQKGIFTLPNLDKGEYLLVVAKLKLRLKIIEETDEKKVAAIASKIIVVFLPPEMVIQE